MNSIIHTPCMVSKTAHPFFHIDLDMNFDIDINELSSLLMAMPNVRFVCIEGEYDSKCGTYSVARYLIWFAKSSLEDYNITNLTDYLYKRGFDIPEEDIYIDYGHTAFSSKRTDCAPLFNFPEGFHLESVSTNISRAVGYFSKLACRNLTNIAVFHEAAERYMHQSSDVSTEKEEKRND